MIIEYCDKLHTTIDTKYCKMVGYFDKSVIFASRILGHLCDSPTVTQYPIITELGEFPPRVNEAKSVAGNHWLRLSPTVALLRGQVWNSLDIRCQQQQLVD